MPHTISSLIKSSSLKRGRSPRRSMRGGARRATSMRYGWWGPGGWIPSFTSTRDFGDIKDSTVAYLGGLRAGYEGWRARRAREQKEIKKALSRTRTKYNAAVDLADEVMAIEQLAISDAQKERIIKYKKMHPEVDTNDIVASVMASPRGSRARSAGESTARAISKQFRQFQPYGTRKYVKGLKKGHISYN